MRRAGMFVHFGMSTYIGEECPDGQAAKELFAPTALDVDQWTGLARDAGMGYVVLTAKHVAGHCLWPSAHTDYHVDDDIVGALAESCARRSLGLGLYYCSWDNHHRFGTVTAGDVGIFNSRVTARYFEFQMAQIEELLTRYAPVFELWVAIFLRCSARRDDGHSTTLSRRSRPRRSSS